ncbi:MAG: alanyl-tRNA editing protein [Calditrichaceae bacterium]
MNTEKVYYQDSDCHQIEAAILDVQMDKDGIWVLPDRTIFYPGGGGQSRDEGRINGIPINGIRIEDEQIWHCLAPDSDFSIGDNIGMEIDRQKRLYNMQQHTGQHLLSHVLDQLGQKTVSVHLGDSYTLIEVEGAWPVDGLLKKAEEQSNAYIRQSVPVSWQWVSREDIHKFPLRRPAGDWQTLRLVEIEKIDYSACGGTHVKNTAEIGYIKITALEKIRGRARIKAFIGQKADDYFEQLHVLNTGLRNQLSSETEHIVERVQGLKSDVEQLGKDVEFYRQTYIDSKCQDIINESDPGSILIVHRLSEGKPADAQDLARTLSGKFAKIAFMTFADRFYLTAPADSKFSTQNFLKTHGASLNLRGGGPEGFAQGIAAECDTEKIKGMILNQIF